MIQFRSGFYADVRVEDRSRTVISYKAGKLEEMRNRRERQAFLRVYDGKLWYYASTTDTGRLQETLDGLYAAAEENPDILEDPVVRRFEKNRDRLFTFTDCSVREIAQECGFSDQGYFTKVFSASTGFSPTEFRRKMLEPIEP